MGRNIAHTSSSRSVDGANEGKNNVMERGGSVVSNPIWEPGGANSPKQRFGPLTVANQTGPYGQVTPRFTPDNQTGKTGDIQPGKQPNLRGSQAK